MVRSVVLGGGGRYGAVVVFSPRVLCVSFCDDNITKALRCAVQEKEREGGRKSRGDLKGEGRRDERRKEGRKVGRNELWRKRKRKIGRRERRKRHTDRLEKRG